MPRQILDEWNTVAHVTEFEGQPHRQVGQDPASGPYAYYCGASHAELWRIQHSYDEIQRSDGQVIWIPSAPVATVNAAVSVCIDALAYPVARALALLGRGASCAELHHLRHPLRSALTLR